MPGWLVGLAGLVLFILLILAAYYQWQVYVLGKKTKAKLAELDDLAAQNRAQVNQSIQIICRALIERQVECTEAGLRVSELLNQLGVAEHDRTEFVAFDKIAEAIRHIPILERWRSLTKEQRLEYREHLNKVEDEYGDFARDAAQKLLGKEF